MVVSTLTKHQYGYDIRPLHGSSIVNSMLYQHIRTHGTDIKYIKKYDWSLTTVFRNVERGVVTERSGKREHTNI